MKQYIFIIISLFTLTQYISAQDYNTYVRQFPQAMTAKVIGMKTKENFSADSTAQKAPTVSFN